MERRSDSDAQEASHTDFTVLLVTERRERLLEMVTGAKALGMAALYKKLFTIYDQI